MKKNILIIGCGFVGLSNAFLLAENNHVVAIDTNIDKVKKLQNKILPFHDDLMSEYLTGSRGDIHFDTNMKPHIDNSEIVFIATPTDYNPISNHFDTLSVEMIIDELEKINYKGLIVIKSTIPIGFTDSIADLYPNLNLLFSPEFLRETTALSDNLNPDRIIVSGKDKGDCKEIGDLLKENTRNDADILITEHHEAESIKLFSNTYLAMRVAFFNELDSFALEHGLNAKNIIDGVCKDNRIGEFYNNPSFGYGGYCLPKDTKQLLSNYEGIDNNIIQSIVLANETRKKNLSKDILSRINKGDTVGVYRLIMKEGSDNFRDSSILTIIDILKENGVDVVIYEPEISADCYNEFFIEEDLDFFKHKCDLILCNRISQELENVSDKVYTRDIYHIN